MSNIRHQNFRSFLTDRLTAMAVEVFGEVEAIVEAYYEENKRLRNALHMVLDPEIKLLRIDDVHHTEASHGVNHQPSEQTTELNMEIVELLHIQPKEEQEEIDIDTESARQQTIFKTDDFVASDQVKSDPDAEDSSMHSITDHHSFKVVEVNQCSSATLSEAEEEEEGRDDGNAHSSLDSDLLEDCPQLSSSEGSTSDSVDTQDHRGEVHKTKRQKMHFLQKTKLELPRMMPCNTAIPTPSESLSFLSRLTEAFKDFPVDKKPLITKMGLLENAESVDCSFGKLPKGSPLSYHYLLPSSKDYQAHDDAPPRPPLPLSHHTLELMLGFSPSSLSVREQERVAVMQITWERAQCLESSTRPPDGHKVLAAEVQKQRLTSRFGEICTLRPGKSNADHLVFKIQKGGRKYKNSLADEEIKSEALREYCRNMCVNWSPCGLVIHPDAPWLGALPHGLVYDPKEDPRYGLVHVKCSRLRSFMGCGFLAAKYGVLRLKKNNSLYWHVQGEMMVTGMSWCDLLLFSKEDILVQRIYRDKSIIRGMKRKLDDFFFCHYLPSLM